MSNFRKHIDGISLYLLLVILFGSCTTDIQLYPEDWEADYIIHSIIDCQSQEQKVIIQFTNKPIIGNHLSGDNLIESFFESHHLMVQEWYNDQYAEYYFEPESIFKQENPSSPITAFYKTDFLPYIFMDYKMVLKDLTTNNIITAKTKPVPKPIVVQPNSLGVSYDFSDKNNPFSVKYKTVPRGYVYRIEVRIKYVELAVNKDTLFSTAILDMNPIFVDDPPGYIPTRETEGALITKDMPFDYLLNIFARSIPEDNNIQLRWVHSFDFTIWVGNEDLKNYLQIAERFSDNRKQYFSNINGGYGLFGAANNQSITSITPDGKFLDSLANGFRTKQLGFVKYLFQGEFLDTANQMGMINQRMLKIFN